MLMSMFEDQILILILEKANIQIMPTSLNIFNHSKIAIKSNTRHLYFLVCKLGCAVRMVVDSILTHAECEPNDHRKDAPPFNPKCICNSNAVVFSSTNLRNIWRSVMVHDFKKTLIDCQVMSNKFVSIIRIRVIVCLDESSPIYFPKRFWLFYKKIGFVNEIKKNRREFRVKFNET